MLCDKTFPGETQHTSILTPDNKVTTDQSAIIQTTDLMSVFSAHVVKSKDGLRTEGTRDAATAAGFHQGGETLLKMLRGTGCRSGQLFPPTALKVALGHRIRER